MGDLFEGYELAQAWDEVFGRAGVARGIYRQVIDDLQPMTSEDLAARLTALDRAFRDQGITFSLLGEERTFPLDLIPRLIGPDEWAVIETGVAQRVAALEAFLRDVYGPAEVLRDGVVPYRVVQTSAHFCRAAYFWPPSMTRWTWSWPPATGCGRR